ncbi:MAG: caspase family protein, partial [Bacteroidales bacterium]|nr:caspase family protein [Bacteroidales bacterium]
MKTLAITIGNNNYCEAAAKLDNAVNDARAMADVF